MSLMWGKKLHLHEHTLKMFFKSQSKSVRWLFPPSGIILDPIVFHTAFLFVCVIYFHLCLYHTLLARIQQITHSCNIFIFIVDSLLCYFKQDSKKMCVLTYESHNNKLNITLPTHHVYIPVSIKHPHNKHTPALRKEEKGVLSRWRCLIGPLKSAEPPH